MTPVRAGRSVPAAPPLGKSLVYLLFNLPIGIAAFVTLVTLVSVGVSTAIVWVGLPVAGLAVLLVRGAGRVERARLYALLDTYLPIPYRPFPANGSHWRRWGCRLRDPATWRDAAYFLLLLPLGIAEFTIVVTAWASALWLVFLPLYQPWWPDGWHPVVWNNEVFRVDTWPETLPLAAIGVLFAAVAVMLTRALANAHGRFAAALLGSRSEDGPGISLNDEYSRDETMSTDVAREGRPMPTEKESAEVVRPHALRAIAFMVVSFPMRIAQFVLVVTLLVVGIGTVIIWVGVPILLLAFALIRGFADLERRWVGSMLKTSIPPAQRTPTDGGWLQRWRTWLTDSTTWRDLGYLMLMLPIGVAEFALGIVAIVLLPVAIWVMPSLGWLQGQLALTLLGPPRTQGLAAKARQLQASRARGVDAAEAERKRIERDLHDGAQQRLVSLAMSLGRVKAKLNGDDDGVRVLIDEAHSDAKLAVSELRDLARGIYPAVLADRGLDAALSAQAAKSPIPVEVQVDVDPRPPAAVETTAYFIVGETLANIAKHAGATEANVKVWREGETVTVEVTDDGRGGAELREGGGLSGLADRAATIDGVISVVSPVGGPTVVRADLPCAW